MEQVIELPTHTLRAVRYLQAIEKLVATKGLLYGDSLTSSFAGSLSGVDGPTGILARIEDKLGRLANLRAHGVTSEATEDTIADLIGYLALLATYEDPNPPDPSNVIDIAPYLKAGGANGTH